MKIPTKETQAQRYALASGRRNLGMLAHGMEASKDNQGHDLHRCKLKKSARRKQL